MSGKVMNLTEAVEKFVHDGSLISFGGFSATQCPMSAVHEIIRQGKKNLHVVAASNGQAVDELVGAGCVEGLEVAYAGCGRFASTCFRIRKAAEQGTLRIEDYSNYQMTLRFMAGSMGMPFMPTYSTLGTDIVNKWTYSKEERKLDSRLPVDKMVIIDNPFMPDDKVEKVMLVPALQPDVTFIHAQKADKYGNIRLAGLLYADIEQAKASKHLVVTCEEIVESDELRKDPDRNQILSFQVSAVIEEPWGAYPCAVLGCYDYDPWFLRDFYKKVATSKEESDWQGYLDKYIYGVKNREEFMQLIGKDRMDAVQTDEESGFRKDLNRR
jgi:glutaconate CoA-transferase subunit A